MIKFESLNHYDNVFLVSDSHFSHKNICRGTSSWFDTDLDGNKVPSGGTRDFDTLEGMNQAILKGIEVVGENDVLLHCGDVAFGGKENIYEYVGKCKGDIMLTAGNHDHHILKDPEIAGLFKSVRDIQYVQFKGQKIVMCHYPMLVWHQSHKKTRLAYGHVHGSNPGVGKSQDVGVDVAKKLFNQYRPFTFAEFIKLTDDREIYLESHHGPNTN